VFWEVADRLSIPDADWYDAIHFRITGAVQLSQWLGLQIGEAANRGLFEGLSSLQEPPLQNPQLEPPYYLEHDGVFPETNQSFVEYESLYTLTPPDATILNPSNGLGSRDELQMQLGFFIDWAVEVEPSMYDNLFDFRIVLDRMRFEDELVLDSQSQAALTAWRQTKQASDLHAAGIDYLIFSGEWLSFTSAEEATTLTDPAHYELVATWQHKVSKRQYWLYRVLGC
jgi:hypothetical protein